MPKLFSYCIPVDDGAAPNPYWGICTLAICKPVIRRVAEAGDWVVGTGSKKYGFENKVVYAMEVTQKLTLADYDDYCRKNLVQKIPSYYDWDIRKRVGDCIYDYSTTNPPLQRLGVHDGDNITTDLGGKYALLSTEFYYFGKDPVSLPCTLHEIIHQGQGHKSDKNAPFVKSFISWIKTNFGDMKNQVNAQPYYLEHLFEKHFVRCARQHKQEDNKDEKLAPHC